MSEKKTEEQLRQEIIEEYSFEEEDERIDKILEIKKDRYTATQAKKRALEEAENLKKGKDYYKNLATSKEDKSKDNKDSSGDKTQNFSLIDQTAIIQAGIKPEILGDVIEELNGFSKMKNISIVEALKSSYIKSVIAEKEEALRVADATNTSKSRKGKGEVSEGAMLDNFSKKGEVPESDEDMKRFLEARLKAKS